MIYVAPALINRTGFVPFISVCLELSFSVFSLIILRSESPSKINLYLLLRLILSVLISNDGVSVVLLITYLIFAFIGWSFRRFTQPL